MRKYWPIVVIACTLHLTWAIGLIASGSVSGITAVHNTVEIVTRPGAVVLYTGVAILALVGLVYDRFLLVVPQQIVLFASLMSALLAVDTGHYANGVMLPRWFIASDQLPMAGATTLVHLVCLLLAAGAVRE